MKRVLFLLWACGLAVAPARPQADEVLSKTGGRVLPQKSPTPRQVSTSSEYSLVPDTKGNRLELTVANESSTASEGVEVRVGKHPAWITFTAKTREFGDIVARGEATATLPFDVGRVVSTDRKDTLEFLITDNSGLIWTKSVIIRYTGPTVFALDQNFPNPFNPSTTIQYQLPADSRVSLKVYDMLGREVATIVNEERPSGYHEVRWIASNTASGVYFYRLEAQPLNGGHRFQSVRRLMVLK